MEKKRRGEKRRGEERRGEAKRRRKNSWKRRYTLTVKKNRRCFWIERDREIEIDREEEGSIERREEKRRRRMSVLD